jgi:ATP-dependent helicase STH1/SNF2
MNFICPKIFDSSKSFKDWFNSPFAGSAPVTVGEEKLELNEEEQLLIIKRLHKVLRPFLLRRLKKDVEADLPDKVEAVVKIRMSALQQRLYDQVRKHRTLHFGTGTADGKGKAKGGVKGLNNVIQHLRKICNHPFGFPEVEDVMDPNRDNPILFYRVSGKFELLDRILPKYFATGHRVLMFFQMTMIMDLFAEYMNARHYKFLRLDGNSKSEVRSESLALFNARDSEYKIFILSTRAGGLGLNLQVADTVIIFDSDWNPHQDLQAQDRAHRIGQTKEVRILRLVMAKTVEEHILTTAQHKLDMDGKVIQAGKFDNRTSAEEREAYLRALLEAGDDDQADEEDAFINDDDLNRTLARSEEEYEIFTQMDRDRPALDEQEWVSRGYPGHYPASRLLTDEELPQVFREEHARAPKADPVIAAGRGSRVRAEYQLDPNRIPEEAWLHIQESVDPERAMQEYLERRRDHESESQDESVTSTRSDKSRGKGGGGRGKVIQPSRKRSRQESSDGDQPVKRSRVDLEREWLGCDAKELREMLSPVDRERLKTLMLQLWSTVHDYQSVE